MTMNRANFAISGPRINPTADDYALEAQRLRAVGAALVHRNRWTLTHHASGSSGRYYQFARRFEAIARRLSWVPVRKDQEKAA